MFLFHWLLHSLLLDILQGFCVCGLLFNTCIQCWELFLCLDHFVLRYKLSCFKIESRRLYFSCRCSNRRLIYLRQGLLLRREHGWLLLLSHLVWIQDIICGLYLIILVILLLMLIQLLILLLVLMGIIIHWLLLHLHPLEGWVEWLLLLLLRVPHKLLWYVACKLLLLLLLKVLV